MTISSETRKAGPTTGNGVAIAFPFAFKVFDKTDVKVTLTVLSTGVQSVLILDSDYTTLLNADQNAHPGGTVTYSPLGVPMSALYSLTISSQIPNLQDTNITSGGAFLPDVIEDMVDKAVACVQQLKEQADRSLKFPLVDATAAADLPPAAQRASKLLSFDINGAPQVVAPSAQSASALAIQLAAINGSDLIGFQGMPMLNISRTVTRKLQADVSFEDGGAVGGGVVDDSAPIIAVLNWVKNRGKARKIFCESDSYLVSRTLPLNISGLPVIGQGADEGRSSWGNWPTRFIWGGAINSHMFEVDTLLTGVVHGVTLIGIVIDAQNVAGVTPLYANVNSARGKLKNVCFRNYDTNVYLGTSCYGWDFDDVEVFNSQGVGILLEGLNHHTSFRRFRGSGTSIIAASSLIRVGNSNNCSAINFHNCDFEASNTTYQVELLNCRAVDVNGGGYSEAASNGTAIFRLGVTGTTACDGFKVDGFYTQGNDPTDVLNYLLDVKNASGVDIGGGCHFRNIHTALINSPAACPNSAVSPAIHLENVGGTGNTTLFDGLSSGWRFCAKATVNGTLVGDSTAGTNLYTQRSVQYRVDNGQCEGEGEITLTGAGGALASTGNLTINLGIPYQILSGRDCLTPIIPVAGVSLTAGDKLIGWISAASTGTAVIILKEGTSNSFTAFTNAKATDAFSVKFSFRFPIAPGL